MFDPQKISVYLNLGLIALFVLFVLGLLLAIIRGLRRGVWKSTHNMIFMLSLVIIAFATLDPLCKFAEGLDLSRYFPGSFYISRTVNEEVMTYYIPITSVLHDL